MGMKKVAFCLLISISLSNFSHLQSQKVYLSTPESISKRPVPE